MMKRNAKPKRRVGMLSAGVGMQLATAGAGAGGAAPSLVMPDREEEKSRVISGSITTLLHAAIIGVLILLAWLAPPVEEIIPVKIIRELPGAKVEPPPARKILQPRTQRAPVQAARQVTAQAVQQPRVMQMTADQLKINEIQKAVAPQVVERRQVVSQRVQARSIDTRVFNANVDLSKLTDVAVPTDLDAPVVSYDGPRQIDQGSAVNPEAFAAVPTVESTQYSSAAPVQIESSEPMPENLEAFEFDTEMGVYAGGANTGGTGTAADTVRCLESAYVDRYLEVVKVRTQKRWVVPEGAPGNQKVTLKFVLDASGTATKIEFEGVSNTSLGNSAVTAMRAASPFPPMDENVRCLSGMSLKGHFFNDNL